MICLECNKELGYLDHKNAMESAGVELCMKHHERIKLLINKHNTPLEAIQLYYALKEAGVNPMLEWWDGKKSIDIAISRVKLNIEIDSDVGEGVGNEEKYFRLSVLVISLVVVMQVLKRV